MVNKCVSTVRVASCRYIVYRYFNTRLIRVCSHPSVIYLKYIEIAWVCSLRTYWKVYLGLNAACCYTWWIKKKVSHIATIAVVINIILSASRITKIDVNLNQLKTWNLSKLLCKIILLNTKGDVITWVNHYGMAIHWQSKSTVKCIKSIWLDVIFGKVSVVSA